jgi:hypothetical protein
MKTFITVLIALLLAPVASARLDPGAPVPRDARIAAAEFVAGHPVSITCEPLDRMPPAVLAFVFLDDSYVIHLGPYACEALKDPTSPIFGAGLLVLAHEAEHLAGLVNESAANCAAIRDVEFLAQRFWRVENQNVQGSAQRLYGMTPDNYRQCG